MMPQPPAKATGCGTGPRVRARAVLRGRLSGGRLALLLALVAFAPPGRAQEGDAIAIINGEPLSRTKVVDTLLESHGLRIMQQHIALELARQETRRRGLSVTAGDIEAQVRRAIEEIVPPTDAAGVDLNEETKRRALRQLLDEKCLTMTEFLLAMERNAHLRKLAEQEVQVTEATLREEFARTYDEKVEVRDIVIPAGEQRTLQEVLSRLGRGEEFAEVARLLSTHRESAARGGLLAPFTFGEPSLPPALRELAFTLKPGEVSTPTQTGDMIHVLRVERRIPPEGVRFEDVKEQVAARVRERAIRQKSVALMNRIFEQAQIRVLDKRLAGEFEELRKQQRAGGPTP